jgi:hypothetical protein
MQRIKAFDLPSARKNSHFWTMAQNAHLQRLTMHPLFDEAFAARNFS